MAKVMIGERKIVAYCREIGLDCTIKSGSRHRKIYVGPHLVGVFSKGQGVEHGRDYENLFAQLRRFKESRP